MSRGAVRHKKYSGKINPELVHRTDFRNKITEVKNRELKAKGGRRENFFFFNTSNIAQLVFTNMASVVSM